MFQEDEAQQQAISSKGNMVLLAGPGAGKSRVLVEVVAEALAANVRPPSRLAFITYSNECARGLARKLRVHGTSPGGSLYLGTTHAFCLLHILIPFSRLAGVNLPSSFRVASESQQAGAWRAALRSLGVAEARLDGERFRLAKARILTPIRSAAPWGELAQADKDAINRYENYLRAGRLIDFDDMVILASNLVVSQGWIRQVLKARFPVIVIDEYQDLGVGLHAMVVALLDDQNPVRIVVAGDPRQSIYGFNGARPELLQELADRADTEDIGLTSNFRAGHRILDAICQASPLPLEATPRTDFEGVVNIELVRGDVEEQCSYALDELIPAFLRRNRGCSVADVCFLYADKNIGERVAASVEGHHSSHDFIRHDGLAPYPRTPTTRFIEDCAAWCVSGWQDGVPSFDELVRTWHLLTTAGGGGQSREATLGLAKVLGAQRKTNQTASSFVEKLLKGFFEEFGQGLALVQAEASARQMLVEAVAPGGPYANWTMATLARQDGVGAGLTLSTIHQSKGDEFAAVILVGANEDIIPRWSPSALTEEELQEAENAFFVAISRASRELHVLYGDKRKVVQRGTGKRFTFDAKPSRFVTKLQRLLASKA